MKRDITLMRSIQQIKRRYRDQFRPLEQEWDLTGNEIDVLLFLNNNPEHDTATDIVEMRGLSKSHVCKSVDALMKRGFLLGVQDQQDRRVTHLRLRYAASKAVSAAQALQRAFFADLYAGVTEEELRTMESVLRKIRGNLDGGSEHGA